MRAFDIHAPLPAAGLVLVLMNVAMLFPLWPGNIGLVQAAIALPLVSYGVDYPKGFAFGIGLQAIEMSVGVGVGLIFLAREGLSYAMLKRMPGAEQAEVATRDRRRATPSRSRPVRALASPASCKGALSAVEAALALGAGLRAGGLDVDEVPVADGGAGTAEVLAASVGGEWRTASASDPLGRSVAARFLVLEDGTAVVEAAEAVGLARLAEDERIRCMRPAAGWASSCLRSPRRRAARSSSGSAIRPRSTGRRSP